MLKPTLLVVILVLLQLTQLQARSLDMHHAATHSYSDTVAGNILWSYWATATAAFLGLIAMLL